LTGKREVHTGKVAFPVNGNTNAASIKIGEKAAKIIACNHRAKLRQFVGGK